MSLKLYRTLLQLRTRFADIVDSWLRVFPAYRDYQRTQKLLAINLYYERIRKLEAWRRARGRKD